MYRFEIYRYAAAGEDTSLATAQAAAYCAFTRKCYAYLADDEDSFK